MKIIFGYQRKALRAILRLHYRADVRKSFKDLNILTLPGQYIYECLVHVHVHRDKFPSASHAYGTRGVNSVAIKPCRLDVARNCSNWWGPKFYNTLPENIRALDKNLFKKKCKKMLTEMAPYVFDDFLNEIAKIRT